MEHVEPVAKRLLEEQGLLARLTRLGVLNLGRLPPLPGAPDPERCPGGMRMEDLLFGGDPAPIPTADAAALAAWPMPRLRRLVAPGAALGGLRALLNAPWAAGLEELGLPGLCYAAGEGALGAGE
jgi:hypothetical protein